MEHTFYDGGKTVLCPLCGAQLLLQPRPADRKQMMLVHPLSIRQQWENLQSPSNVVLPPAPFPPECERSGMAYYAGTVAAVQLTMIPEDLR